MTEPNFSSSLGIILLKICALAGIKTVIDDFTKRDIINMIFTRFKHLSTADIWKAFELERYGVYESKTEHFQLFDTNYISEVLKKYIEWVRKEKTMLNYIPPTNQNIKLSEMTDSSKKEIMTKAILKSFEHFLISGTLPSEPQEHIYEELRERGFIKSISRLSDYYKKQYGKALTQVKDDLNKKMLTDFSFRELLKQKIKDIENGNDGAVIVQMKRNILCDFFEKYKNDSEFIQRIKN